VFAVGTPVAGNDSVAAVTAGINLGTAPTVRPGSPTRAPAEALAHRALLLTLLLVLAVHRGSRRPRHEARRSRPAWLLWYRALARRGPPAA
jgi:hypothetical protein